MLRLPFVPDLLTDQRLGAVSAWILGEVPVLLAVLALVLRWTRADRSPTETEAWQGPRFDVDDMTYTGSVFVGSDELRRAYADHQDRCGDGEQSAGRTEFLAPITVIDRWADPRR